MLSRFIGRMLCKVGMHKWRIILNRPPRERLLKCERCGAWIIFDMVNGNTYRSW